MGSFTAEHNIFLKNTQNIKKHLHIHIMQIYDNLSNIRFAGKKYEIKHQRLL